MVHPSNIMIIDEDKEDVEIFCDALHEIDVSIECIQMKDGIKALKLLSADPVKPEYIFVDLNMTQISGKKWLTDIKKNEALKNIPVIIYSGSRDPSDVEEARKKGASFYLPKPFRISVLKQLLTAVFEHRQKDFYVV